MTISDFIEFLLIGALYLLPYFVIHYTHVCYKQSRKLGFFASIKYAYNYLPDFIINNISLDVKTAKLPTICFLFLLTIIGMISNGLIQQTDIYLLKLKEVAIFSSVYDLNKQVTQYKDGITIIKECKKEKCLNLLNKIDYQNRLTRHGIVHSMINLICLFFILCSKKFTNKAKLIWFLLILTTSQMSVIGFLSTKGWYEGISKAILMYK